MVKASVSFIKCLSVGPGGDGTRLQYRVLMFGLIKDHLAGLKL